MRERLPLHGHDRSKSDAPPLSGFRASPGPKQRRRVRPVYPAGPASCPERSGWFFPDKTGRPAEACGPGVADRLCAVANGPGAFTCGDVRSDNMVPGAAGKDDIAAIDRRIGELGNGLCDAV
jgi:hypothetical protein